jgi:tetratricopeptide (TPR) repeat protein
MNIEITRYFVVASLLSLVLLSRAHAQPPDQATKFRLAQSYEQAGNFETAAKMYEELLAKDQSNYVYFDSVRRMYLQLKHYDDAIALIQQRLSMNPGDLPTRAILASTYYKTGNEKEAYAEWEKAIATNPDNSGVYRLVAQSMLENRLLDKVAELYRRARVACKDPNLFTMDLAQLLATSMDYAGASAEFLLWLKQNPTQLSFLQSRMATYTNKEEGRAAAIEAVKNELRRDDDPKLYELLGWVYLEGKNYADAFDAYRKLDKLTKAQGGQIYAFAERAFKERAFDAAAKAYLEAINAPVVVARLPYAKYGYANSLKEMSALSDTIVGVVIAGQLPATESQPQYAGAIGYFREIIKEYPRSEFSAKSYYQIGTIQFERFFDLDGAFASFENVEREFPGMNTIHYDVALKIGEVLTAKGDTARAAWRFRFVVNAPNATPDQHDEASYRLAEIEYFGGKFQDAIQRLGEITLNLKADYANDALQLLSFLQENKTTGEAALTYFARADFLAKQRKNTEAIPLFLNLIEKYPQALLTDDALMKVAVLQAQARLFVDAIKSYERLLSQFKESSISLDKAQFNIGEIHQFGMNDKAKAISAYERLLADFPQSILATVARKRIRELRGDSL